eukprot:9062324-Pyramimonas_sp.AAC.1
MASAFFTSMRMGSGSRMRTSFATSSARRTPRSWRPCSIVLPKPHKLRNELETNLQLKRIFAKFVLVAAGPSSGSRRAAGWCWQVSVQNTL